MRPLLTAKKTIIPMVPFPQTRLFGLFRFIPDSLLNGVLLVNGHRITLRIFRIISIWRGSKSHTFLNLPSARPTTNTTLQKQGSKSRA